MAERPADEFVSWRGAGPGETPPAGFVELDVVEIRLIPLIPQAHVAEVDLGLDGGEKCRIGRVGVVHGDQPQREAPVEERRDRPAEEEKVLWS